MGRRKVWIWLAVLAAAVYLGWHFRPAPARTAGGTATAGGRGGRGAANAVVPVVEATASKGSIPIYLRGIGTVAPALTVTLHSRVDGQIMSVHFTEGQFVHAGDLLVEIDPRPYEATLAQVQGTLAHDTALYNDDELDYQRYLTLYNQKIVSQQQVDTQAALVNEYKGAMAADQAAIETAKLNVSYTHVTAPIDGRIGLRLVDPGNIVHANDTQGLAVITQVQPIAVLFSLPQEDLPQVYTQLREGHHPPVVAFDSTNTKQLAVGTLLTIDNSIDATTGTFKSKAMFNNQDNALFPNQFVNARMEVGTDNGLTIVPPPAIQRGPQGTYVFVVADNDTVSSRPVTVARTEGSQVGLSAGLNAGEHVVVDGADKLQDGTKVEASSESASAAPADATPAAAAPPDPAAPAPTPVSAAGKGRQHKPRTAAGNPASRPGR